jgi:hypothetical protein
MMSRIVSRWLLIGIFFASCAPKPILYPNQHYKDAGRDAADQAIEACSQMAKDAGATPSRGKTGQVAGSTAGGGAVVGHAGRGAMVGAASGATAGFLRGLFRRSPPSQAYKEFVQRCLKERGYDPVGWE